MGLDETLATEHAPAPTAEPAPASPATGHASPALTAEHTPVSIAAEPTPTSPATGRASALRSGPARTAADHGEALAAAERAVELSGSDPAGALSLAHEVLASLPASCPGAEGRGGQGGQGGQGGCAHCETEAVAHRALAVAARELGDLPFAEERLRHAVEVALSAGLRHRAAQARLSLVHVRTELGHPEQALVVAADAEPGLTGAELGKLGVHRAVALARLGRYREAVAQCDRAVAVLGGDVRFMAGAMLNRGLARVFLGEFTAAEADLSRCAELARDAGLEHLLALAEGNLPFLAARRGDLPAAFTAYRRAEVTLFGFPERLATVRCDLAEALIAAHLPGEARVLLEAAVPELVAAGAGVALAEARLLLARVELRTGDPRGAAESAELAARELAAQGRTVLVPLAAEIGLRARLALDPPSAVLAGEMLSCADDLAAAGYGDVSAALRLAAAEVTLKLGDTRAARDQLAVLARAGRGVVAHQATALLRHLAGDRRGAFAAVLDGLAEVGTDTGALEDPMLRAHAVRAGEPLAGFGLELALRTGRGQVVLAWAERWRAVTGGSGRPLAPGAAALREALGRTLLVEFVRHRDELVAVAVTRERVTLHRLGRFAVVAEAVIRLRYGLRRTHLRDGGATVSPAEGADAAELERLLLWPLRDLLGDRSLVVVPTGSLHTLPWPLLPSNAGRPVTVAASAAAWLAARRGSPAPGAWNGRGGRDRQDGPYGQDRDGPQRQDGPGRRLHDGRHGQDGGHGKNRGRGGRGGRGRVVTVAGPGLRCAEAEAAMVGRCHPGTERVAARRKDVLAALEGVDMAHLAAHGVFSPRAPLLSSIDLDDGALMAHDLLRLRVPPALVVLSACDAGMAHAPADGAPLGLAGTFLSLGSRCVVASLVPVRDEETLTLMTAFHAALAAGDPPARALAVASGTSGVAGFVCFGFGDQPVATGRDGSLTQSDHDPT
ncbi:CHAT domain-containing tetratricopeptide repeat protein [Streptosporangium sp. NPDC023615]|uniref:CHAT domain-containing protein n=1 Tax=Streptosporangium sp. NPDC023615 TaxID=3154794 RepID=UPI0034257066